MKAASREGSAVPGGAGDLVAAAVEVGAAPERRREELIEQAERDDGWPRPWAERVHDVAVEEGLSPGLAFLLVRAQVGVSDPPPGGDDAETSLEGPPEWVEAGVDPALDLRREGRLRRSFRRLRGHLERAGSVEAAVRAFVAEPDVDDCAY